MRLTLAHEVLLDTDARQVLRNGSPVRLSPKAYELLTLLVDARPRALSKNELYSRLWPDTFVVDANLANLVAEIRSVLGDAAHEPRLIRTVHRFGYAFCGEAREADTRRAVPSSCGLIWNGQRFDLAEGENILGRDPDAHLRFALPSVSRHHARVVVSGEMATIQDLGSKNGTSVAGRSVADATVLRDGEEIRIGSVVLVFRIWPPSSSTETLGSEERGGGRHLPSARSTRGRSSGG